MRVNFRLNTMKKSESNITDPEENTPVCIKLPVAYILEKHRIVEIKAYNIAESDSFTRSPEDYWLSAEIEINKKIM